MLFHITQGNMISKVAFSIIYLHLISKEKGILGIKEIKIAAGSTMDIPRKRLSTRMQQNIDMHDYMNDVIDTKKVPQCFFHICLLNS